MIYELKTYLVDNKLIFSKKQIRSLLRINHRRTLNQHIKALNLTNQRLGWAEIKEILALKLFLYARLGYHTREMYVNLKTKGVLPQVFAHFGIDIEREFRRIQDEFNQQQQPN